MSVLFIIQSSSCGNNSGISIATRLGNYHQQLVAHSRRQLDAAKLNAAPPAGNILGQQSQQHSAKLFNLIVVIVIGTSPPKTVALLMRVVNKNIAVRCQQRLILASYIHAPTFLAGDG